MDRYIIPLDKDFLAHALRENTLLTTLDYQRKVDSTNRCAAALLQSRSFNNGTVILADEQTAGEGRRGRAWFSPKYANLYASVILKNIFPANQVFFSTVIASLAVRNVLNRKYGLDCLLKWPNDVMVGKRKIAGILIEFIEDHFIIGIGVNVNFDPSQSLELKRKATSVMKELGKPVKRETLAVCLFKELEKCCGRYPARRTSILNKWVGALEQPGREIAFLSAGKKAKGVIVSLNPDGSLNVKTDKGVETLYSIEY